MAAQGKAQAGRARFASQHAAPVPTFDGTGCVACGATTCRRWFFDRMSCTLPGIVDALEAGEALPTRRWFCTGKAQTSACRTAMKKVPAKDLTEWDGSELPSERTLRFDGEAFIGPFVAGTSSGLTVGRRGQAPPATGPAGYRPFSGRSPTAMARSPGESSTTTNTLPCSRRRCARCTMRTS